jgi:hypothetical protein
VLHAGLVGMAVVGDFEKGTQLGDLFLISLVSQPEPLDLLTLPAEQLTPALGLLQQLPVVLLQGTIAVLDERHLRVCAAQGGGGLRPLERFGRGGAGREVGGGLGVVTTSS